MAARFLPPASFPRLSAAAKALAETPPPDPAPDGWVSGFELEAESAETVLGLLGLPLAANADSRALTAVAEQINFRLAAGEDHGTKGSESRGEQSIVVARNPRSGEAHAISPIARAIADALLSEYAGAAAAVNGNPVHGNLPGFSALDIVF
ncbi:MAG TPA: hypothetical protein VFR37_10725 [Longimicrobium sp.]|nr:hypothetical protein [Longimicrobium sp.]